MEEENYPWPPQDQYGDKALRKALRKILRAQPQSLAESMEDSDRLIAQKLIKTTAWTDEQRGEGRDLRKRYKHLEVPVPQPAAPVAASEHKTALEAVAYGGRGVVETMDSAGLVVDQLVARGGGSRSDLWMQIHADVFHRSITVLAEANAAALGAAMCAAVGSGVYTDLRASAREMTRYSTTFVPNPDHRAVYDDGYAGYLASYASHRNLREVQSLKRHKPS